jgi:hypothetical protein
MLARMGYSMRFFVEDGQPLTIDELSNGLRAIDREFRIEADGGVRLGEELLGQMTIDVAGEELFQDEIDAFVEMIQDTEEEGREGVAGRLREVTAMLTVRVVMERRTLAQTLAMLDPLWAWLLVHRRGLVQADGEGFYEDTELILALA